MNKADLKLKLVETFVANSRKDFIIDDKFIEQYKIEFWKNFFDGLSYAVREHRKTFVISKWSVSLYYLIDDKIYSFDVARDKIFNELRPTIKKWMDELDIKYSLIEGNAYEVSVDELKTVSNVDNLVSLL